MRDTFEVAGGSVVGTHHIQPLRWTNNQDAFCFESTPTVTAAIVCDGCSSAEHAEIGAHIATRFLTNRLITLCEQRPNDDLDRIIKEARHELIIQLDDCIRVLGGSYRHTLFEYGLFTVVGAIITRDKTITFSIGDAHLFVNGDHCIAGPFPDNKPPYLAYALVRTEIDEALTRVHIHHQLPTSEVQTVLIGTDGLSDFIAKSDISLPGKAELLGPIAQFWEQDRYFANPDMIRRRLALANRAIGDYPGLLTDDTTLITIRRKGGEPLCMSG